MDCQITPISAFPSTNLNSKIKSFTDVANRITRQLGAPVSNLELHQDQIMEFIAQSCEFFTKYAGMSKQYIIFDSRVYERGKGVRMDHLYTLASIPQFSDFGIEREVSHDVLSSNVSHYLNRLSVDTMYVVNKTIDLTSPDFALVGDLQPYIEKESIARGQIMQPDTVQLILDNSTDPEVTSWFTRMKESNLLINQIDGEGERVNVAVDYDLMDYRKVSAVCEWTQGQTSGINTLFSIEQTLAQQTYFSYALANHGFDLVSWYIVKDWMDMREKLLATKKDIYFDKRTQYLKMSPEPRSHEYTVGVLECWVEDPLRDVIKEHWVQQYALALTKIAIGHTRGQFQSTQLFGGGTINAQDMMSQGLQEKEKLEDMMMKGATSGFGDSEPPIFMVG
tara:strand:- start:10594 stop:11772 length:1179 start_codon:yes stop_codon:yes gene_type:complete